MLNYRKIPITYFIVGAIWILVSDKIVELIAPSLQDVTLFQTLKGWTFIAITTLLVWTMARRQQERMKAAEQERHALYNQTIKGVHHILLNYLNKMQLLTLEAETHESFNQETIKIANEATDEAAKALKALQELPEPTTSNVEANAFNDLKTSKQAPEQKHND